MKFIVLQGKHLGFQVNGIQITMKKAQGLEEEHLALCRAHPTAIPTYTKISRMSMGSWLNGTGSKSSLNKSKETQYFSVAPGSNVKQGNGGRWGWRHRKD